MGSEDRFLGRRAASAWVARSLSAAATACAFGQPAIDFALMGVDERRYSLADVRGAGGTLVAFICNHCPYVKVVIDRLVEEARELSALGVGTIAIMANDAETYPEDSFGNMRTFARAHGFAFPYVVDDSQEVARASGAQCTPDFFGFNARDELQYHGRLDASRTTLLPGARRELYEAMRQIAETGYGPVEQLPSIGCSIKWRE
jgi:peroxiredoxin